MVERWDLSLISLQNAKFYVISWQNAPNFKWKFIQTGYKKFESNYLFAIQYTDHNNFVLDPEVTFIDVSYSQLVILYNQNTTPGPKVWTLSFL